MARPIKKEPDYFPLDTDLLSNRKIRQIKRKYGSDAFHYILPCFVTSMPMAIISRPTRKSVSLPSSARYSSNTRPVTHWNVSTPPMSTNPCKSGDWSTPPRGETPRHEPLRLLATTGSPAHQRGLSADDGATAGDGVVAAEVFRWADNRRESKTNHLLWRLRNKTYTLLI